MKYSKWVTLYWDCFLDDEKWKEICTYAHSLDPHTKLDLATTPAPLLMSCLTISCWTTSQSIIFVLVDSIKPSSTSCDSYLIFLHPANCSTERLVYKNTCTFKYVQQTVFYRTRISYWNYPNSLSTRVSIENRRWIPTT